MPDQPRQEPRRAHVGRAVRYLAIGTSGYFVNLAAFWGVLHPAAGPAWLAVGVSYVVNTAWNFLLNRRFTFEGTDRAWHADLGRFLVVAGVLFVTNYLSFGLFYGLLGIQAVVAQALAIVVGLPIGFLGNLLWAFAQHEPAPGVLDAVGVNPGSATRP